MMSRGRLADDICRRLSDDIVLGRFAPGGRLEEVMLAEQYGVSRTPIREALKQLAIMGLVECRPNRGSVVASISAQALTHMFEAIGELEAACARYAALRMTDAQREQLSHLHAQGRAAMQARDSARYDRLNTDMHTLILEGSHNPVLIETAQALRHRVTPYRRTQFARVDRIAASYAEHCDIVEAILACDAVAAYREMRRHVSSAHEAAVSLAGADASATSNA